MLPPDRLLSLTEWRLRLRSNGIRRDLLTDIRPMVPVLERLGGNSAITQLADGIIDSSKWWP